MAKPNEMAKCLSFTYCKYCPAYRCKSTTAFRNHLQKLHNITVVEDERRISSLVERNLKEIHRKIDIPRDRQVVDRRLLNEALLRLIVENDLPFRAVEWPALHTLLQIANPTIKIVSSHTS